MSIARTWTALAAAVLLAPVGELQGKTIQFAGFEWNVRSGRGGPGPNAWDENNVWVDDSGALHLKIRRREGNWSCAEVTMQRRLGFGRYQFHITGELDRLDENVVLGLFNYPTRDIGTDATHEIDIEFARWGDAKNPPGNYVVWPAQKGLKQQSNSFPFTLEHNETTHRFTWNASRIVFQSLRGHRHDDREEFCRWEFHPADADRRISTKSMPVHINLWLFKGLAPKNGQDVEIVVRSFTFAPE